MLDARVPFESVTDAADTTDVPAQSCDVGGDIERATDQLVDEVCQRLSSLYTLINTSLDANGPSLVEIRAHVAEVVRRLVSVNGPDTATVIVHTLWPPHPVPHIPGRWWDTPLGALIDHALPSRSRAGATNGRAAPPDVRSVR